MEKLNLKNRKGQNIFGSLEKPKGEIKGTAVILHGYGGKTIGKMLLGIRLITDQGDSVGLWKSFVRWIGYYISTEV